MTQPLLAVTAPAAFPQLRQFDSMLLMENSDLRVSSNVNDHRKVNANTANCHENGY